MSSRERRPHIAIRDTSSQSESLVDPEDDSQSSGYDHDPSESGVDDDGDWNSRDDIGPTDSASYVGEARAHPSSRPQSRGPPRHGSRQHSIPRQQPRYPYTAPPPHVPAPDYMHSISSDTSDYVSFDMPRGNYAPPVPQSYYDGRRGGYPQSHVGGAYAPPHPYTNQMVAWNNNPFAPGGQGAGYPSYYPEPRHDMMQYQYPGHGPITSPSYGMPSHHLEQMRYAPPPTEFSTAPAAKPAEEKPNPELEKMKMQLQLFEKEAAAREEAAKQAAMEKKIREDAERALQERMEAMKLAQEDAKKEIELARIAADQAARERIEEERKAEAERQRQQAAMLAKAEHEARAKLEKEKNEEAERQRKHQEELARIERETKEKYEAALQADKEAKERAAKERELLEAAARAKIEADMKAAEDARKAAEAKAAEEAERKKLAEEEARQKAIKEFHEKLEKEKQEAADKKAAEAAAKLKYENEARVKLAKEQAAADEAARKAEEQKKEEEALKKKLLDEAKAEAEKAASGGDGKEPIKFKDAVGRKYSFPFNLACKWKTMEGLINQAFAHIENIGPHVMEGHYDLEGPDGELILKQIWDTTVQPGWQVTMKMWPAEQLRGRPVIPVPPDLSPEQRRAFIENYIARHGRHAAHGHVPGQRGVPPAVGRVPMPPMQPRPPPGFAGGPAFFGEGRVPPQRVEIVEPRAPRDKHKAKDRGKKTLNFLAGKKTSKSKKKREDRMM